MAPASSVVDAVERLMPIDGPHWPGSGSGQSGGQRLETPSGTKAADPETVTGSEK